MNELFLKNTQALFEVDEPLALALRSLKSLNFKLVGENGGVNLQRDDGEKIYQNAKNELERDFIKFETNYAKYPVLWFYGFGSGILLKGLLKNENHKHIIVFEDELAVLFHAFFLQDFSEEIKSERLIIFNAKTLSTAQYTTLLNYKVIQRSIKTYELFIHSDFYLKFKGDLSTQISTNLAKYMSLSVLHMGNDPKDSIMGIEHMLENIPLQLKNGALKTMISKKQKSFKTAIIVSTGPSLTKQLKTLKKYHKKALILVADSAYPILARANIRPDFVFSLERTYFTSEFFKEDFGRNFDKDILFILTSVVHQNTINYMQKMKRKFIITHRPLMSAKMLKMHKFGYLGIGGSVANMAYEFACYFKPENIILIGQDLAYANDGASHPKDYVYGEDSESAYQSAEVMAYGGKGLVKTQLAWNMFRQCFESDIFFANSKLNVKTYNATEGGARIEGAIEESFDELCKKLLNENLKKPITRPKPLNKMQLKKQFELLNKRIKKSLSKNNAFIIKALNLAMAIENMLKKDDLKLGLKLKERLLRLVASLKKLDTFNELILAPTFHNELEIAKFEVLPDSLQEKKIKDFLSKQKEWLSELILYLKTQEEVFSKALLKYERHKNANK